MFCFSSFECYVLEPEGDKPLLAGISQSIFSLEFSVCSTVGWCSLYVWSAAVFLTLIFCDCTKLLQWWGFSLILWDSLHLSPKRECMVRYLSRLLLLQSRSLIFGEVVHCRLVGYRCFGTTYCCPNTCYQLPTCRTMSRKSEDMEHCMKSGEWLVSVLSESSVHCSVWKHSVFSKIVGFVK